MNVLKKLLLVFPLLLLVACTSVQTSNNNGNQLNLPTWVYDTSVDSNYISAVGSVKVGPTGVPIARNIALAQARTELGRTMEVKVASLVKNYLNITGLAENQDAKGDFSQTSKQLSIRVLKNSKQLKMFLTKTNDLYILVGILREDIEAEARAELKGVTDKLREEEKISTRLNSQKAQEDLEKAINSNWAQSEEKK